MLTFAELILNIVIPAVLLTITMIMVFEVPRYIETRRTTQAILESNKLVLGMSDPAVYQQAYNLHIQP